MDEAGENVSGGEAQKLAIARALYKDAPFVVLDEPTAALDPLSEYEIYSRFDELVRDKTSIYISHRMSSCRFCQDILVFQEGRLVGRAQPRNPPGGKGPLCFPVERPGPILCKITAPPNVSTRDIDLHQTKKSTIGQPHPFGLANFVMAKGRCP